MNGLAYEADYIVAWPTAEIAVMGPDGAVDIIHRKTLEAVPEEERAAKRLELAEEIRANIDPYIAAGHAQLDDVIDPAETRARDLERPAREPRQARRPPVAQARRPPRLTRRSTPSRRLCRSVPRGPFGTNGAFAGDGGRRLDEAGADSSSTRATTRSSGRVDPRELGADCPARTRSGSARPGSPAAVVQPPEHPVVRFVAAGLIASAAR